ncbi:MAG TPA: cytochrome c [Pyrinomonadaceae bacterium]|nr:cytochrome c [Pyrinomonadaceae bacterium]
MKLFKLTLVVLALASFAAACGNSQNSQPIDMRPNPSPTAAAKAPTPAATPDELADARSTFKNTCSRCHKDDGTGGPTKLDDGTTLKVPDLHGPHTVKRTDEQLAAKIENGGDGMPRFKDRLDQQKVNSLVRFIRHDFQASATGGASPAPSR